MELNDILKDDAPVATETPPPAPEPTPAPAPTPEPAEAAPPVETTKSRRKEWQAKEQEAQGRKRNPDGTFAPEEPEAPAEPKVETKPEAPTQPKVEMTDKEKGLLKEALAERAKRQELERRLAALEQQRAAPVAPAPQPEGQPAATPTFWDNPDAVLQQYHQNVQQTITQQKMAMSEDMARRQYPDFEEKLASFGELLKANPWLGEKIAGAPNPAEAAYRLGKNRMDLEAAGNLDGYRQKIEEEVTARVRKEIEAQQASKEAERAKLAAALPRSLSDVRGSAPSGTPVWGGPTPLDAVIKH